MFCRISSLYNYVKLLSHTNTLFAKIGSKCKSMTEKKIDRGQNYTMTLGNMNLKPSDHQSANSLLNYMSNALKISYWYIY